MPSEFRGDANATDVDRWEINFSLVDQEIFRKVVMAFHLSHAGEVTFGYAKMEKNILCGGPVGSNVQSWSCE